MNYSSTDYVNWFRNSAPYINAHRERTFVLHISGEAICSKHLASLVHDIALLNSLGIKLILVHGAEPQIAQRFADSRLDLPESLRTPQVSHDEIILYQEAVSSTRIALESALSMGLANSPMAGMAIRTVSGNFVVARPRGIIDGKDFGHSGLIRRIDTHSIIKQLQDQSITILSPLGYSRTGEVFYLDSMELASQTAISLKADKLIWLGNENLRANKQSVQHQLNVREAQQLTLDSPDSQQALKHSIQACERGVRRVHMLSWLQDGALLLELFTRDGVGTMVTGDNYDYIRQANIEDVGGVLELIEPLEQTGVLVRRSREHLEMEISHFTIMERDGTIIACSALYPFADEKSAELACLAVHEDYQHQGRGEQLLTRMESIAARQGIERLFVLTTQATHWFVERGFEDAEIEDLPVKRKSLYNYQRRSKVLSKKIQADEQK